MEQRFMHLNDRLPEAFAWASNARPLSDPKHLSATRDVFRARLEHFYHDLQNASWPDDESSMLTAAVGEIGNNCFDHNLGQWRDEAGCWFEWGCSKDQSTCWIIVSDRGQGVRASLGRVDPSIHSDQDAVNVAFSKIISGRSPEKRGNGLKFVRQIVNGNSKRGLLFLSGAGKMVLGSLGPEAERLMTDHRFNGSVTGTWALLVGEK